MGRLLKVMPFIVVNIFAVASAHASAVPNNVRRVNGAKSAARAGGLLNSAAASPVDVAQAAKDREDKAFAKSEYKEGLKAYNLGSYTEAIRHFEVAYRRWGDPMFLYNIAQCRRQLGEYKEALRVYERFLHDGADEASKAIAEQQIAAVKAEIAKRQPVRVFHTVEELTTRYDGHLPELMSWEECVESGIKAGVIKSGVR